MSEIINIIQKYETEYQSFIDVCHKIKTKERLKGGVCGIWSPKQVVDHFSGWAKEALYCFENIKAGKAVNLEFEDDTFNKQSVDERSNLDWDGSLSEMGILKNKIVEFARGLTDEDVAKSKVYVDWIRGMTEDYQEHRKQLEDWVE